MRTSIFTQSLFAVDLEKAIEMAGEIGFDGIEIACREPHLTFQRAQRDWQRLLSLITRAGLSVSALSMYTNFTESIIAEKSCSTLMGFIDVAHAFETDTIKITPGPPGSQQATVGHWETISRNLEPCVARAEIIHVKLAMETHLNMLSDTTYSTLRLLDVFDSPALGVNLDFCNVFLGGDDPCESIIRLKDKIYFTHVKDVDTHISNRHWTPLGQGELDYPSIIETLEKIGYDGYLSLECLYDEVREAPRDAVETDFRYLTKLGN